MQHFNERGWEDNLANEFADKVDMLNLFNDVHEGKMDFRTVVERYL